MVLFISVLKGISRRQLVKQTLIPWENRRLKKLTNVEFGKTPRSCLDVTSIYSQPNRAVATALKVLFSAKVSC